MPIQTLTRSDNAGSATEQRAAAMIAYLRGIVLAPPLSHERGHAIFLDSRSAWLGDAPCGIGTMTALSLMLFRCPDSSCF